MTLILRALELQRWEHEHPYGTGGQQFPTLTIYKGREHE